MIETQSGDEIELLCSHEHSDVLLLHDAPAGVQFVQRLRDGRERRYASQALGLAEAVSRSRPRLCLFGHHHVRMDAEVAGVRCLGLNTVGRPGNLVAIQLEPHGRDWSILGESPPKSPKSK